VGSSAGATVDEAVLAAPAVGGGVAPAVGGIAPAAGGGVASAPPGAVGSAVATSSVGCATTVAAVALAARDGRNRPSRCRSVTPMTVATTTAAASAHTPVTTFTMTAGPVRFL
jgi:hypothetical protein